MEILRIVYGEEEAQRMIPYDSRLLISLYQ